MHGRIRKAFVATWLGGLACLPPLTAPAEIINRILATVDGDPVTLYEVEKFRDEDIRARQAGLQGPRELLDAFIGEKIVEREVKEKGLIVRDEDVSAYIAQILERNRIDESRLEEALGAQGLTLQAYRSQIREDLLRQQLIAREIRGKVSVSPEEIQRYYDAHRDEYATPSEMEISHIVLALPQDASSDQVAAITAKAEEIRSQAKRGDFAKLARQYSEDASAEDGGKLGSFKKGELLEELETAAAQLKVGEVSPPVRTRVGLHLVRLDARSGEGVRPLEELKEELREKLYAEAVEERFQRWMTEDLRKRHHVDIFE